MEFRPLWEIDSEKQPRKSLRNLWLIFTVILISVKARGMLGGKLQSFRSSCHAGKEVELGF